MATKEDVLSSPIDFNDDADLGRIVRIMWIDSGVHRDRGWDKIAEFIGKDTPETMTAETVGLWMGETEHVMVVAQTRDAANDNWLAAQVIWRPSILSKEWLS